MAQEDKARLSAYEDWIVANKDKEGTPEFETVAETYKALRLSEINEAAQAPKEETPKEPMSGWDAFGQGVRGAAAMGYDDEAREYFGDLEGGKRWRERKEQAADEYPVSNFLGNVVGSLAVPVTLAGIGATAPGAAGAAGTAALISRIPAVGRGVQAINTALKAKNTLGTAARTGAVIAENAGQGAIQGSGDAEDGKRLEGAEIGALIGAGGSAAIKPIGYGIGMGVDALRNFAISKATRARKRFSELFGGQPLTEGNVPAGVSGYTPMAGSDEMIANANNIDPQRVANRIAEQEAAVNSIPQPIGPGDASEPFVSGRGRITSENEAAQAAVDVQQAALNAQRAATKGALETDADIARKLYLDEASNVPSVADSNLEPKARIAADKMSVSESAYLKANKVLEDADAASKQLWKDANIQNVDFTPTKKFRAGAKSILKEFEKEKLPSEIGNRLNRILGLNNDGKVLVPKKGKPPRDPVTLEEFQNLLSDLRTYARNTNNPNEARLAQKLDKGLMGELENKANGAVLPEKVDQLKAAIESTRDYYRRADNFVLGKVTKEESNSAAPTSFLNSILTGTEGRGKQKMQEVIESLKDKNGKLPSRFLDDVKNYMHYDLVDTINTKGVSREALGAWQAKYQGAIDGIGKYDNNFRKNFSNVEFSIRNATEKEHALNIFNESEQIVAAAAVIKKMPKAFEGADDSSFYQPDVLAGKMKKILSDERPDSMQEFLSVANNSPEALNGTRRLVGKILVEERDPAEYIEKNRTKLNQLFDTPEQQEMLNNLFAGSKEVSRLKDIQAKGARPRPIPSGVTRNSIIAILRPVLGLFGSVATAGATQEIERRAISAADKIIVDAIIDPRGAAGTILKQVYTKKSGGPEAIVKYALPMIVRPSVSSKVMGENREDKRNAVQKKADGGPVYTHPAISSIRANRAVSRMAS